MCFGVMCATLRIRHSANNLYGVFSPSAGRSRRRYFFGIPWEIGTFAPWAQDSGTAREYVPIPDYAFDCHTRKGKASGATKAQFFSAEHAALQPFQPGLFDHLLDG